MSGLFKWVLPIGGGLLTAFSSRLPEQLQDAGLFVGVAFVVVGLFASCAIYLATRRAEGMSYSDVAILVGVGFLLLGGGVTAVGLVYHFRNLPRQTGAASTNLSPLVKDPRIDWDGKDLILFTGTFTQSGKNLPIYLDFSNEGAGAPTDQHVVDGDHMSWPRIQIGEVDRFARGQALRLTLATLLNVEGQQQVYRWGDKKYAAQPVGATWGNYSGRIVIVHADGQEEAYPFIAVSRAVNNKPAPPLLIGPGTIEAAIGSPARPK